jgi:hypothetical protein
MREEPACIKGPLCEYFAKLKYFYLNCGVLGFWGKVGSSILLRSTTPETLGLPQGGSGVLRFGGRWVIHASRGGSITRLLILFYFCLAGSLILAAYLSASKYCLDAYAEMA